VLWFSAGLLTYETTGDQTTGNQAVAEVHAPGGSGSPSHRHHREDEAWYILDGELTFRLGNEQRTASAAPWCSVPRLVLTRFRGDSADARFLLLLSLAGFEDSTRTCGSPGTAGFTLAPAATSVSMRSVVRSHRLVHRPPTLSRCSSSSCPGGRAALPSLRHPVGDHHYGWVPVDPAQQKLTHRPGCTSARPVAGP
jgi:quercetin dioxygenase-like cupin family protein